MLVGHAAVDGNGQTVLELICLVISDLGILCRSVKLDGRVSDSYTELCGGLGPPQQMFHSNLTTF